MEKNRMKQTEEDRNAKTQQKLDALMDALHDAIVKVGYDAVYASLTSREPTWPALDPFARAEQLHPSASPLWGEAGWKKDKLQNQVYTGRAVIEILSTGRHLDNWSVGITLANFGSLSVPIKGDFCLVDYPRVIIDPNSLLIMEVPCVCYPLRNLT